MLVKDIAINNIAIGDSNIRQVDKPEELNYLMQTIRDNGLLQPIGVKEIDENKYKILWGNRRFKACQKLGWKTITAVIFAGKDDDMTEEEFITVNAIENLQQSPNTLYEIGRICKSLKNKGMSNGEIAVRLGINKNRVENALIEIQRIPAKWQKKVKIIEGGKARRGDIPMSHAVTIARMKVKPNIKDKIYQIASKDETSMPKITMIGSFLNMGKNIKEAIKESNKYETYRVDIYFEKKILEKALKTSKKNKIDLVIDAINSKYPNLAMKNIKA